MFIGSREIDDERIRALLCEYSNAYLAAPIIEACRRAGLFETLSTRYWVSLPRLVRKHRANSGYLAVALRVLVSIGWLTRRADYHYRLTARAEPEAVANGILVLYEQAFDKILADPHAQALFSQYLQPLIFPVRDASMHSVTSGALTRSLRQAPVALPLLMALCDARGSSLDSKEIVLGRQLVEPLRSTLQSFLIEQGWASATGDANAACRLSRSGRLLFGQIDEMLLAVSYRPTLAQIETLLFGDARSMIRRDGEGEESHIDRSLDLRLIDLQVERYMEDIEWQIINVFNNADFARQPRYIADIGCGDARYLRQVYEMVRTRSLRGRQLAQFPLTVIGVDHSYRRLSEAQNHLAQLPKLLIRADVDDPAAVRRVLKERGIDPAQVLFLRSFLNHDFFVSEEQVASKKAPSFPLTPIGIAVGAVGQVIAADAVVHHWRTHLQAWAELSNDHGAVFAVAHCLCERADGQLGEGEDFPIDYFRALSGQPLIDPEIFLILAANAGLFAKTQPWIYPRNSGNRRATVGQFFRRPYRIRHAQVSDLGELVALAEQDGNAATSAVINKRLIERIQRYPQGQFVVEEGGKIIGAMYSQRLDSLSALRGATRDTAFQHHDPAGPIVQIADIEVQSRFARSGYWEALLEFMLQWCSVTKGVEATTMIALSTDIEHALQSQDQKILPVDVVLQMHRNHGAHIGALVPGWIAQPNGAIGDGVWVHYEIPRRKITSTKPAVLTSEKTKPASVLVELIIAARGRGEGPISDPPPSVRSGYVPQVSGTPLP